MQNHHHVYLLTPWSKYVDSIEECFGPKWWPITHTRTYTYFTSTHVPTHTHSNTTSTYIHCTYLDIRTHIFAAKCWLSVRDRPDRAEATFLVPSALGHLTEPTLWPRCKKRSSICIYWLLIDLIYLSAIIHNLHQMFQPIWGGALFSQICWSLSKYCTCHQRIYGGDDHNCYWISDEI